MDRSHSTPRVVSRLSGIALLLALSGLLAGCALPLPWVPTYTSSSSSIYGPPAPIPFEWNRVTPPPATPQEAFTVSMSRLNICPRNPTAATAITWLVAGPTYGVALARATCSQNGDNTSTGIAIIPIALDNGVQPRCPAWEIVGGSFEPAPAADANLGEAAYQIPTWLPLPQDTYLPQTMGDGSIVPSALFSVESSTRLFVAGRFEGSATRPDGAESVSIGGRSGWQIADHDIVTVAVPLADGWTFFFSGTADGATIQRLASASLGHLDTLLPKPLPTPANYPQPTPAC